MIVPCKNIPTYTVEKREWSTTSFENQKEFGDFLFKTCFKEPGEYRIDESSLLDDNGWNSLSRKFTETGRYTDYAPGTPEYNQFWDSEELKCRLGIIFKYHNKTWYLTRDYYFLLNYCPILNKEKGNTESFMSIRDVQMHMMLYEKIAECYHLHSAVLKRRQMAYSNCHAAKSLNFIWFENKKTIKWFASSEAYLDTVNGSWKMLDAFRNHINVHTDWIRIFTPAEYPSIQQKEKFLIRKGQWGTKGNESTLVAKTLGKDVTSGVGGAAYWIWHEEGGVAPKANLTLQYLNPALESGLEKSGSFHIGGSVGDLDDCKPLENFILKPDNYEIFGVETKYYNESRTPKIAGLFIPAQYGMPQAVDKYGNSQVEKALELLKESEEQWKKLPTEDYILKRSQNPKTITEAFAWRKSSFFNVQRIEKRQKDILLLKERNDFYEKQGLLEISKDGKIVLKKLSDMPEAERPTPVGYPVIPEMLDKRGCVTIWEFPDGNADFGIYFGGCDPVEVGKTTTSDSVFSLHIYKRGIRKITRKSDGSIEETYTKGRLVASYRGRFDNPDDHNEQGLLLLRLYNAVTACERNKPNFINYCRRKGFAHMIARRKDLPFEKDIDMTGTKNDDFGVWAGSDNKLLEIEKRTTYEYLDYEVDTITKKAKDPNEFDISKTIRGYDIVPDYWFLEECKLWNEDANADAFISASLAIIFGQSRELSFEKTVYEEEKPIEQREIIKAAPMSLLDYGRPKKSKTLLNY